VDHDEKPIDGRNLQHDDPLDAILGEHKEHDGQSNGAGTGAQDGAAVGPPADDQTEEGLVTDDAVPTNRR
jgi:hypothetical protein